MSSNSSSERYERAVKNITRSLEKLRNEVKNAQLGASEAHRYKGSTNNANAHMKTLQTKEGTLRSRLSTLRNAHASGKEARNKRVALRSLENAKIQLTRAKTELVKAEQTKEETTAVLNRVRIQEKAARDEAVKAEKNLGRDAPEAKALRKVGQDIEQHFKKAVALTKGAVANIKKLKKEIIELENEIRTLSTVNARPSSGNHTGGTRKLRRKN